MSIVFRDETMLETDGVHDSLNERIWAINHEDADKAGAGITDRKFPQKVMEWLGVCYKRAVSPLIVFSNESINRERHITTVLSVALKLVNQMFGKIGRAHV